MPILAIILPIRLTRVVFAKVRPYEPFRDRCAATAADRSSKTRDAVLAMTLPLDAGVPLEFPMFCPIVTEPRFGHCIPSAPFTPRHCGTPNEKLPRSSQTTTTDAPSLAGAAAAPTGTAPTSAIININSGSNSSINSNISSGGVNSSNSTTSSTTINRTSSNAINSININSRNDRITSNNNSSSTATGAATTATRTASSATP